VRGPHVEKRGSSPFFVLVYSVTGPDGRKRRIRRRTNPPTDSKRYAQEQLHSALGRGPDPTAAGPLGGVLEGYLAHLLAHSPSTHRSSAGVIRWWGRALSARPTPNDVNEAIAALAAAGYSESSLYNRLTMLRAAYRRAAPDHPLARIQIRFRPAERHILWTDDELERVCALLPPWAQAAMMLMHHSGLRVNEALRLRWENVRDRSLLFRQKGRDDDERPLSKRARAILEELPRVSEWVFPSETLKTPKSHRNLLRLLYAAMSRAKPPVKDRTIHDLRRTFAQDLRRAGASGLEIARALGQHSTRLVGRYTESELDVAVALLERAAGPVAEGVAEGVAEAGRHNAAHSGIRAVPSLPVEKPEAHLKPVR
jgi:integrase